MPRVNRGRPRTRIVADTAAMTGNPARSTSWGPVPTPSSRRTAATVSVRTLIALVKKNSPLER
jgi:hypothetical protein